MPIIPASISVHGAAAPGPATSCTRRRPGRTGCRWPASYASFVGPEGHDRGERTEDLLGHDPRVAADAGEHRRLEEVARAVEARPAGEHLGALRDGVVHEAGHLLHRRLVDQRAHVGAGPRARGGHLRGHSRGELLRERVRDGVVHREAVAPPRRTGRSCAASRPARPRRRRRGRRPANTTNGALPPSSIELRSTFFEAWASRTLAHARGAGERDLAQPGVLEQRLR